MSVLDIVRGAVMMALRFIGFYCLSMMILGAIFLIVVLIDE